MAEILTVCFLPFRPLAEMGGEMESVREEKGWEVWEEPENYGSISL